MITVLFPIKLFLNLRSRYRLLINSAVLTFVALVLLLIFLSRNSHIGMAFVMVNCQLLHNPMQTA